LGLEFNHKTNDLAVAGKPASDPHGFDTYRGAERMTVDDT
jgi:hypothetical protein